MVPNQFKGLGFLISVSKDGSSLSPPAEASQVLTSLLPPGFCLLLQLLRIISLALDSVVDLNQWEGWGGVLTELCLMKNPRETLRVAIFSLILKPRLHPRPGCWLVDDRFTSSAATMLLSDVLHPGYQGPREAARACFKCFWGFLLTPLNRQQPKNLWNLSVPPPPSCGTSSGAW